MALSDGVEAASPATDLPPKAKGFELGRRRRMQLTIACAIAAAAVGGIRDVPSDQHILLGAARGWMAGQNPYDIVGPGRPVEWAFLLLYPFTAVLLAVPFALVPVPEAWFAAAAMALFVWGVTSRRELRFAWFAFATFSVFHAAKMVQWSPLLTGAALVPMWGFALACKPTIGAALWIAYPKWVSLAGSLGLLVVSLIAWPEWPFEWWKVLQHTSHMQAPVTYWAGPLILLGLLRWRRPEARLLVALACVPQTAFLYEALPLFLIPRKYEEGFLLALASHAVLVVIHLYEPVWQNLSAEAAYVAERQVLGQWMVWLLYLPCLVMVLRRPNINTEGSMRRT
jgi:hypothetical protein